MGHWIKLMLVTRASYVQVLVSVPGTLLPIELPANVSGGKGVFQADWQSLNMPKSSNHLTCGVTLRASMGMGYWRTRTGLALGFNTTKTGV